MTQHKHAETLRAIADGAKCSDERPCIPCYTDQGHCEDEQPVIAHVDHDTSLYAIALQQAIEAHCRAEKVPQVVHERCPHHAAMLDKDLCSRLEQPEDEPAAYRVYFPDDQRQEYCDELDDLCEDLTNCRHEITPLYAAAPVSAACNWPSCKSEEYQKALAIDVGDAIIGKAPHDREWVGLTDGEIRRIIGPWGGTPVKGYTRTLFDQIEAKLKEKNTL